MLLFGFRQKHGGSQELVGVGAGLCCPGRAWAGVEGACLQTPCIWVCGDKAPLSEVGMKPPSAQHDTFLASSEKGPLNRWQSMLVPGHLWQQAGGGSSAQGAISKFSPV